MLQLLGDFVPRPSTGAVLLDPLGHFRPPDSLVSTPPQ